MPEPFVDEETETTTHSLCLFGVSGITSNRRCENCPGAARTPLYQHRRCPLDISQIEIDLNHEVAGASIKAAQHQKLAKAEQKAKAKANEGAVHLVDGSSDVRQYIQNKEQKILQDLVEGCSDVSSDMPALLSSLSKLDIHSAGRASTLGIRIPAGPGAGLPIQSYQDPIVNINLHLEEDYSSMGMDAMPMEITRCMDASPVDNQEDHHSGRDQMSISVPHVHVGVEGKATDILDQPDSSVRNIRRVEAVEAEEVRRPRSASKRFYNFLVLFFILLEPLLSIVEFLNINQGRLFLASLIQWCRICAGKSAQQVPSRSTWRIKSKNLITGRFLGQGCSGIFYETTWSGSHETTRLARKLFPGVKGDIFESEVVRLFEHNDHPNIVKILCWTVDNRSCSLVMEYVRDNLSSVMRKKEEALRKESASKKMVIGTSPAPFQLPEALELLLQIAIGMQYLHDENIIHGDLKPNNVLIDWSEDGRMLVKLADFGLIESKRRATLISQRALCSQMIEWSAPELFEDYFGSMSEDVEYLWTTSLTGSDMTSTSIASYFENRPKLFLMTKADSYSFALICAYILGGKMWNANLSRNELRKQISNYGLRPELPSECPKTLASLISLCWDAQPLHRPTFSFICKKLEEIVKEQRQQELAQQEQLEEGRM